MIFHKCQANRTEIYDDRDEPQMDVSTKSEIPEESPTIESDSLSRCSSRHQCRRPSRNRRSASGPARMMLGETYPRWAPPTMPEIASPTIESAPSEIDEMPQEPVDPTNAKSHKTFVVIHLGPSQEKQGSTEFSNLRTVNVIDRRNGTSLPVTQDPTNRVITIVITDGEPSTPFVGEGAPVETSDNKTPADTLAGHPDEITGVQQGGDHPSDVEVSVVISKPFQSPTIESESAPEELIVACVHVPDEDPEVPVEITQETPAFAKKGGDESSEVRRPSCQNGPADRLAPTMPGKSIIASSSSQVDEPDAITNLIAVERIFAQLSLKPGPPEYKNRHSGTESIDQGMIVVSSSTSPQVASSIGIELVADDTLSSFPWANIFSPVPEVQYQGDRPVSGHFERDPIEEVRAFQGFPPNNTPQRVVRLRHRPQHEERSSC